MEELLIELNEEMSEINVDGFYLNNRINEFIELANNSILGSNFECLMNKAENIIGYLWALCDMQVITTRKQSNISNLLIDIVSESIFQE